MIRTTGRGDRVAGATPTGAAVAAIAARAVALLIVLGATCSGAAAAWTPPSGQEAPASAVDARDPRIEVIYPPRAAESIAAWSALGEQRPALRGFWPELSGTAPTPGPIRPPPAPDAGASARESSAAEIVATRLAFDGLLETSIAVVAALRSELLAADEAGREELLRRVGLPLDLLGCFDSSNPSTSTTRVQRVQRGLRVIERILEHSGDGAVIDAKAVIGADAFGYSPTDSSFRVATESGEHEIGLLRIQLTRGTYWVGPGAGGSLDLERQLVAALPDAKILASIESAHLADFLTTAADWSLGRSERLAVIVEPLPVAQWAQDNGKAGVIERDGATIAATLIPRYASRYEDASMFIPGETLLANGLAAAGHAIVHSPLLFQGGNLLAVRDPASGQRILLVGEAEIARNTAMGLTRGQAERAFAREFGVDRVVVLPAISFHVDFDVSVRSHEGRLIAFVNDSVAAARGILACGLQPLVRGGVLDQAGADAAVQSLRDGTFARFFEIAGVSLQMRAVGPGQFPEKLAQHFSAGPADSGVANFERFLMAMDVLAATMPTGGELPGDRHLRAYMDTFVRREQDRAALCAQLEALGWTVVPIPSLSEARRGINYINGLHTPTKLLMPAWGGLYGPLDEAAAAAYRRALGAGVEITPIYCAETQTRAGGPHCAAAAYP